MPTSFDTRQARRFARVYERVSEAAERKWAASWRSALLAHENGVVLDVGAGTGANLPHLRRARRVIALEPSTAMRERLAERAGILGQAVEILDGTAERIPLPDNSIDVVACTLVLCSVEEPASALTEIRRVLRPTGRLVLMEHVRGHGLRGRAQQWITRPWRRLACGCRPGQDTAALVREAGFRFTDMDLRWPRSGVPLLGPLLVGVAVPPRRQLVDELRWLTGGADRSG